MNAQILVVIPCWNEEKSVVSVIQAVQALGPRYVPLVVDDGSSDQTACVAQKAATCLRLCTNLGIGGAVQAGLCYARDHSFSYCAQCDGDGQHPAGMMALLLQKMEDTKADLVVGSRYLQKTGFQSSFLRRAGSKLIAKVLGLAFGCRITDPTSGLRLMNRNCIELFARHYPYDYPEPVSLAQALGAGLRVEEAPVEMTARRFGTTSIRGLAPLGYMVRVLSFILIARMRRA